MSPNPAIEVIVVGGSAGGLEALSAILGVLPEGYPIPVVVVLHIPPTKPSYLADVLEAKCRLDVREIEDKEPLVPGAVLVGPPNYHVLLERGGWCSLSIDEPVNFSRPSIDVLFESAAEAFGARLIGVLLSGANDDGASGIARIKAAGGTTVVQSPETAAVPTMPQAAMKRSTIDQVLPLAEIGNFLARLAIQQPSMEPT
jgi:two-component system, chemotaxis family, protein-glutamate methylesterase/glutaminase